MSNVYKSNGINQWFVNALRSENNSVSTNDFINMWTNWSDKLSYQFDHIITDGTASFDNEKFYITEADYGIHLKKTTAAKSMWLHSIAVSLFEKGSFRVYDGAFAPTNNGDDWTFRLDTLIPFDGDLNYYDVRKYKVSYVDVTDGNNYLLFDKEIPWDFTNKLTVNLESTNFSSIYEYRIIDKGINIYKEHMYGLSKYDSDKQTYIEVPLYTSTRSYTANPVTIIDQDIIFDNISGAINRYTKTSFVWPTFDNIHYINVPNKADNIAIVNDGVLLDPSKYIINGTDITIDKTVTIKNLEVFNLTQLGFQDYDILYDTNTNSIRQYRRTTGMWVSYSNTSNTILLPDLNGTNITIINEGNILSPLEYTISGNKLILNSSVTINRLEIRAYIPINTTIEEIHETFTIDNKYCPYEWKHSIADRNVIKTFSGMPATITGVQNLIDFVYGYSEYLKDQGFIFNDIDRPFVNKQINTSFSWQNEIINLINKIWNGYITSFDTANAIYDYYTLNPFKYELWISTPQGIISDIINGPYRDISLYPLVFDRHGNTIPNTDNLKIFRTDTESHITYPYSSDNNYIGGMRVFLDFYENVVEFNDYTTTDNLMYDSFIGLNTENVRVSFNKNPALTRRPNIGGGILVGDKIVNNIEASTNLFQQFYNVNTDNDKHKHIRDARHTLGYFDLPYFNQFDDRTKFLFWRGLVQNKGTSNITNAMQKDKLFSNIDIDELWMYKVADFGDIGIKDEQYIDIYTSDVSNNNLLYEFTNQNVDNNFVRISSTDTSRWSDLDNNLFINKPSISNVMRIVKNTFAICTKPHKFATESLFLKNTIILENECDYLEIYAEYQYNQFFSVSYDSEISVPYYIPNTGMISCFVNGVEIPFNEIDSNTIDVGKLSNVTDIDIRYNRALLKENEHYIILRNNIIKLYNFDFDIIDINLYNFSDDISVNLMDKTDSAIIDNIHYFNPRLGHYNPLIKDNTDYILSYDPANYTDAIWSASMVGTKWLNIRDLGFHHYNDERIYPDTLDRIALWGALTDWSKVTCYEWVESDVPPDQWVTNTNIVLSNDKKITGVPYRILQKSTRSEITDSFEDWYNESNQYQIIYLCMQNIVNNSVTLNLDISINTSDNYKVYVNEKIHTNYSIIEYDNIIANVIVSDIESKDIVRIIRFADTPIDSDFIESPDSLVLYRYVYNYTVVPSYDSRGLVRTNKYYFWASNQISRNSLSTNDIEQLFVYNKNPYFGLQLNGDSYNQWIIKNMRPIGKNNVLHIIKDETLTRTSDIEKHNSYTEWDFTSQHNVDKVDIRLWNKLIETMIGSSIDMTYEVPAKNNIIFDSINQTTSKYGIGKYQCLGDKHQVIDDIKDMLYYQLNIVVDRDKILAAVDLSNPMMIIKSMKYLYDTLPVELVNEIFFNVLRNLYTYTDKVENIIKTSYVSLHCTQVIYV